MKGYEASLAYCMCGINGTIGENSIVVEAMNKATAHRGPDQSGFIVQKGMTLGNNRLAVIDLTDAGKQPITTTDGRFTIVFNGEIYNYKMLRSELEAQGITFRGGSDTEVLLYAFATWGPSCVTRLRGMWGFAVHDTKTQTLFLSRDPFGIKPLYLYDDGTTLAFSSEIRGLLAHPQVQRTINHEAAAQLVSLGYIVAPKTILSFAQSLLPGETVEISIATRQKKSYFNRLEAPLRDAPSDKELEDVLTDSIRHHLIADVPVGLFFSGGIDSTVLAVLLKQAAVKLTAFHISVPGRSDTTYARAIAKECNLTLIEEELTPQRIDTLLNDVFERMDEPLADSSLLPTLAVASLAQGNATVVLSGEGGDELFGGYPRVRRLAGMSLDAARTHWTPDFGRVFESYFKTLPGASSFVPSARGIVRRAYAALKDPVASYLSETALLAGAVKEQPLRDAFKTRLAGEDFPDGVLALDRLTYLPDNLLLKGDTATMARSLEGRVPFLDRRVFETIAGAPLSWKREGGVGKAPLRRLLQKHLPENLINRPKSGFGAPIAGYLLERGTGKLAAALRFYLESFPGLLPSFDAAAARALSRNDFGPLIRFMGYSAYAAVALHSFKEKHGLSVH